MKVKGGPSKKDNKKKNQKTGVRKSVKIEKKKQKSQAVEKKNSLFKGLGNKKSTLKINHSVEESRFLKILKFLRYKGKRIVFLMILMMLISICFYTYHRYVTYNSIQIVMRDDIALEYGTNQYDIHDFIETVEGKIVSIRNEIDTTVVGEQEVVLEVEKGNIVKDIPILVSVVDTIAPVIEIKDEKVSITKGKDCNFVENLVSVKDEIDGDIPYNIDAGEDSKFYYNFIYDASTIGDVGQHEVKVLAKDKNGNSTEKSFILEVVAPRIVYQPVYYHLPANANAGDLISIAYSLLGAPYGPSNGPYSFDCSGFVQYVYKQVGISVSRSTSTQIRDGVGVSYDSIQPGDIICWGYSNGTVTHSALYVGNGQMIHAANYSMGVILSDVSYWLARSGTQILSVRRIV